MICCFHTNRGTFRKLSLCYLTRDAEVAEILENPFGAEWARFLTTKHTEAASRLTEDMVGRIRAQ